MPFDINTAEITRYGAQKHRAALTSSALETIAMLFDDLPTNRAGIRLRGHISLNGHLAADGPIRTVATEIIGSHAMPVRAILFDKTAEANWSLGWHQDRTIAVRKRVDVPGYGPWTIKSGIQHVSPPFELLAGMVTLRIHLDPVSMDNAPLLIAPESHRLGLIPEDRIPEIVERCGKVMCLADAGDIWAYSTPIVHASESARVPVRRRVLQVDYANAPLPRGLHWLGI